MVVICKLVFLPIGRNSYAEYIITVNGLIFIIISTYICKKNKNKNSVIRFKYYLSENVALRLKCMSYSSVFKIHQRISTCMSDPDLNVYICKT